MGEIEFQFLEFFPANLDSTSDLSLIIDLPVHEINSTAYG